MIVTNIHCLHIPLQTPLQCIVYLWKRPENISEFSIRHWTKFAFVVSQRGS